MAKLLYSKGIFVTFVNTDYNHKRFLKSGGAQALDGLPGFNFESIPDGLHSSDSDVTQDITALCHSIFEKEMLLPFKNLLTQLNTGTNQVTSILSDGFMPFAADAAHSHEVPIILFWTVAACAFMGFLQFKNALERGLVPFKDDSYLTNGCLDTIIDWIPGMGEIRFGDLPSHIRIKDSDDVVFKFVIESTQSGTNATGHVLHTFDDLELKVLNAISSMFKGNCLVIREKVKVRGMDSLTRAAGKQAHVVCIPLPFQSHIKGMLKMAKLLYSKGIFITFVNTEFNHRRLLKSEGAHSLDGLPGFKFETFPDGLDASESDNTQDLRELCALVINNKMAAPLENLLRRLNAGIHQVTSVLSDGFMSWAADVAHSLGIPVVKLWTVAGFGFMGIYHFKSALERGLIPLKGFLMFRN
uniref:Glycosyltransferase N-terminal domain-containing protein n=1 Tax=Daucus carota subsp. sativus TaxID=79200 RepID=A0A166F7A6_DAUCS